MKHMESIDDILNKINEMQEFCKVNDMMREFCNANDDILPFMEGLFIFLRDIMPLMTEINTSLRDGNRKLPTASEKISSVTSTTEMATHEIMDMLDNISKVLPGIQKGDQDKVLEVQKDVNDIILALQF